MTLGNMRANGVRTLGIILDPVRDAQRLCVPRGTFGFDHLVDRAAIAGNIDVDHAVNMRPFGMVC